MIVKVLLILPLECIRFFLGRTVTLVNFFSPFTGKVHTPPGRIFDRLKNLTGHYVPTELCTTRRLNFHAVKVLPSEQIT